MSYQMEIRFRTEFASWPHEQYPQHPQMAQVLIDIYEVVMGYQNGVMKTLWERSLQVASGDKQNPPPLSTETLTLDDGKPLSVWTLLWFPLGFHTFQMPPSEEDFTLKHVLTPSNAIHAALGGQRQAGDNEEAHHRFGDVSRGHDWLLQGEQGTA